MSISTLPALSTAWLFETSVLVIAEVRDDVVVDDASLVVQDHSQRRVALLQFREVVAVDSLEELKSVLTVEPSQTGST